MKLELDTQYWINAKEQDPDAPKPEHTEDRLEHACDTLNADELDKVSKIIGGFLHLAPNVVNGVDTDKVAVIEDDELSGASAGIIEIGRVHERIKRWIRENMEYCSDRYKDEEFTGCGPTFGITVSYDYSDASNYTIRLDMVCYTFGEEGETMCSKLAFGCVMLDE